MLQKYKNTVITISAECTAQDYAMKSEAISFLFVTKFLSNILDKDLSLKVVSSVHEQSSAAGKCKSVEQILMLKHFLQFPLIHSS